LQNQKTFNLAKVGKITNEKDEKRVTNRNLHHSFALRWHASNGSHVAIPQHVLSFLLATVTGRS